MLGRAATTKSTVQAPGETPGADQPIQVMIVDDSAVVRGLVSRWIGEESGLEVVARHANGTVEDVAASAPDIVVLDIEMPVMDGLEALPRLLRAKPGVRVLMASTLTRRNAEISFKALSLGALDYVPKPELQPGADPFAGLPRGTDPQAQGAGAHCATGRGCRRRASGRRWRPAADRSRGGQVPVPPVLPGAAAHHSHR